VNQGKETMMKISAMIFAAGLGTRLYPLTTHKPKALLLYKNKPLLSYAIEKILATGIQHIVINIHHFADQIEEWVMQQHYDAHIEFSDERTQLLDTGGGLKWAEPLLNGSSHILLYNTDIISSINLLHLLEAHKQKGALVTLAVRARTTERYFLFEKETMQLCGWCHQIKHDYRWARPCINPVQLAFSGIHVVKSDIFSKIASPQKQSLTSIYLNLATQHHLIGYLDNSDFWKDMGKNPDLLEIGCPINGRI